MTNDTATADEQPVPSPDESYPESWIPWKNPDQPDTLVGDLTSYDVGPDLGYGEQWICTVVDRDDKPWTVWIGKPPEKSGGKCSVLWREFERHKPQVGERVTIRHRGFQDEPRGGGPGYRRFTVTVDRGQLQPPFLTQPQLEVGHDWGDIPIATAGLPPVPSVDVTDADVVEERGAQEGGDDFDKPPF